MRFECDSCHTRYTVSDEVVHRKALRIRCRICGSIKIVQDERVVRAASGEFSTRPGTHVSRTRTAGARPAKVARQEARGATPTRPLDAADALGGHTDWYMSIDGEVSGPFSRIAVARRIDEAGPDKHIHVWKEWMPAWKTHEQVQVIARELGQRRSNAAWADLGSMTSRKRHLPDDSSTLPSRGGDPDYEEIGQTPPPQKPLPPVGTKLAMSAVARAGFGLFGPDRSGECADVALLRCTSGALCDSHTRRGTLVAVLAIAGLAVLLVWGALLRTPRARAEGVATLTAPALISTGHERSTPMEMGGCGHRPCTALVHAHETVTSRGLRVQ